MAASSLSDDLPSLSCKKQKFKFVSVKSQTLLKLSEVYSALISFGLKFVFNPEPHDFWKYDFNIVLWLGTLSNKTGSWTEESFDIVSRYFKVGISISENNVLAVYSSSSDIKCRIHIDVVHGKILLKVPVGHYSLSRKISCINAAYKEARPIPCDETILLELLKTSEKIKRFKVLVAKKEEYEQTRASDPRKIQLALSLDLGQTEFNEIFKKFNGYSAITSQTSPMDLAKSYYCQMMGLSLFMPAYKNIENALFKLFNFFTEEERSQIIENYYNCSRRNKISFTQLYHDYLQKETHVSLWKRLYFPLLLHFQPSEFLRYFEDKTCNFNDVLRKDVDTAISMSLEFDEPLFSHELLIF